MAQQVTRVPVWRPGDWVIVAGRPRQVRQLVGSLTGPEEPFRWRVILRNGETVSVAEIERRATAAEAARAEARLPV